MGVCVNVIYDEYYACTEFYKLIPNELIDW